MTAIYIRFRGSITLASPLLYTVTAHEACILTDLTTGERVRKLRGHTPFREVLAPVEEGEWSWSRLLVMAKLGGLERPEVRMGSIALLSEHRVSSYGGSLGFWWEFVLCGGME